MLLEKTDTGYSAYGKDKPIFTTAKTISGLTRNAYDAVQLFFEERSADQIPRIQFEIDFAQFFKYYRVLNTRFLAERIGMNPTLLSQYINGHKKPSPAQRQRILAGIRQIGEELAEISFKTP
jgi:transcriptional regulator with XRE-family HTH domain